MQQIQPQSTETASSIASEAESLRRFMDSVPATTPTREKAHQATMRAFAKKIGNLVGRKT